MKLSDFDFDLPEALIATRPAKPRSSARLLLADGAALQDRHVYDLPDIFQPGDLLVLNDTKVIPARLFGLRKRESEHGSGEAKIEVTLLEPSAQQGAWRALIKPLRKIKEGEQVTFSPALSATLMSK
ncbi:MAG: S-adenosylmethionine:tRNA ribosyltransferase-isomerase, partial [Planktotalea sp.]|uniref:S-adenosylmethionine:tRNA ribosyltransferase-isomerase n=1 Tax=Planktotalea sp. TaxID=2029877 RepID=UPI003C708C74